MTRTPALLRLAIAAFLVAAPLVARAEQAPSADAPATPASPAKPASPSGKKLDRTAMLETSRAVTRGYYDALIQAKYDVAASFLHPSAIEPLRARVIEDLEKGPPARTQNTLSRLGIKDLTALRTMTLDRFYEAWAKSSYGQGIQVLAREDLVVDVVLMPPTCSVERRMCRVDLKLRARGEDGTKMESPSTVWVLEHEGRWLLTTNPPA